MPDIVRILVYAVVGLCRQPADRSLERTREDAAVDSPGLLTTDLQHRLLRVSHLHIFLCRLSGTWHDDRNDRNDRNVLLKIDYATRNGIIGFLLWRGNYSDE